MSFELRRTLAALIALLMLGSAVSTTAMAGSQEEVANAPVVFDVLVMRPVGFVTLVLGTGLFLVSTPLILVTRPQEIGKPFDHLVAGPARFLWVDPLGGH